MRKLLTLLVALTLATSSGCCSKVRNWFHKGAPCGTQTFAPTIVGPPTSQVPLAPPMQVTVPVATMAQPSYGVPCCPDPCAVQCCPDPCATSCCQDVVVGASGWVPQTSGTTAYFGGITDTGADCGCNNGGAIQYAPPASVPDAAGSDPGSVGDPRPLNESSI
jgi:hypothetical protein